MTPALTHDTQEFALACHALLRDLDPARLNQELAEAAQRRLQALGRDLEALRARYNPEEARSAVATRLAELQAILAGYHPKEGARAQAMLAELWGGASAASASL